jgi:hypothetical protein
VSAGVVWRWRKAFQVDRTNNPGSQRLIRAASQAGASVQRGQQLPPEQVARRRQTALELNLGAYLRTGYHGPRWSEEQLALLGTADDETVAALVGRTTGAVRSARRTRGIPTFRDRRSSRGQRNALG